MNPNDNAAFPRPRIGYWVFNYMPKWEAVSMEVQTLSSAFRQSLGTRVIALNVWGRSVKLKGHEKHVPLPYALPAVVFLPKIAAQVEINHIFASPTEPLLTPRLAKLDNTVLTVAKDSPRLDILEKNAATLKKLRYIVVESSRHKDLFLQLGVQKDRLQLIYPGVDLQPYRPAGPKFTILFATSPFSKYDLLARGIHLMIRVAKLLPEVQFRLIWRRNVEELNALLSETNPPNVSVVSGFVEDMGAQYDSSHTTILPSLTDYSLKPSPHSALLSLAHGKPLLVSRPASMAGVVERAKCGVVFEPSVEGLCEAVNRLMSDYPVYQKNAHAAATAFFSKEQFLARYAQIYDSLLAQ